MRFRVTLHSFVLDLGLTAATEFAVAVVGLLIVSLIGRDMGAVALGEYLLLRRVAGWLQSGAEMGMWVALPRYVAHSTDRAGFDPEAYFLVAVGCAGTTVVCLALFLNAAVGPSAHWLLGTAQLRNLILPLSVVLVGLVATSQVYGYYRGRLVMKWANTLQLCTTVVIPLTTVLVFARRSSVALIMTLIGGATVVAAGLFAAPIIRQVPKIRPLNFMRRAGQLLRYGVTRMPGDLGGTALFTLGPIIASHYLPMSRVAALLLGLAILNGVSVASHPLNLVLLSKISTMLAENRLQEVRVRLGLLMEAVLELTVFGCLQLVVFTDVLVRLWVGSGFQEGIGVIRIVILAVPFFSLYVALGSAIDAASVTAYNARNISISLATFLALVALFLLTLPARFMLESIAGAFLVALVVLASLTCRTVRRLFDMDLRTTATHLARPLLFSVLLGGISFFIYSRWGPWMGVLEWGLLELGLTLCFLSLSNRLGSRWLAFFWETAFTDSRPSEATSKATG